MLFGGGVRIGVVARFRFLSVCRRVFYSNMEKITKTEEEWKKELSAEEYKVIRQKGTEARGGEYDKFYPKEGHFVCRACKTPLYSAEAKFASGCGWPAFDKCYKDAVKTNIDMSFGIKRIEIVCGACDGHLGHVFEGEKMTDTNERHCVNSVSVKYVKAQQDLPEAKVCE